VPTRTTEQNVCGGAGKMVVFEPRLSQLGVNRDIHAISGKLSTNGTVRRREDRSEIPPLLVTRNSSHIWSTSANQTSVTDDRWNLSTHHMENCSISTATRMHSNCLSGLEET